MAKGIDMYKKYFKMEENKHLIAKAIPKLAKLFDKHDIDYCLIGGASLPEYNLNRATDDVDFLIYSTNDVEKLLTEIGFEPAFKGATRKFIWKPDNVMIEFLFTGEETGGTGGVKFEKPKEISKKKDGIKIITLAKLIEYKLSSGMYGFKRLKDWADVEQLIELNNLPEDFADSFRNDLKNKYRELWKG